MYNPHAMSEHYRLISPETGEPIANDVDPFEWPPGLRARFDLERVRESVDRASIAEGPPSLWRYAPLLPVADPDRAVTLSEGWTPMLPALGLARELGLKRLLVKDEGRNPTGTFKDRGASVGVTRLRELGVRRVALASSGNAGAAWAIYSARGGIECLSVLPDDVLGGSLNQCVLSGADTLRVEGRWQSAGGILKEEARSGSWFNVSTLREPFRLEGKKTMGFEIAEQLGWELPDVLVYPTGGGLGPIAIYKAFEELIELGWVEGSLPRLVITQYEGCAPIVRAFREDDESVRPWDDIRILPGGLKAATPPGGDEVLARIRETGGTAYTVSTDEALDAVGHLTRVEGIFACPESATTIVGLRRAIEDGHVAPSDRVVVVSTGHGLKSVANLRRPETRRAPGG